MASSHEIPESQPTTTYNNIFAAIVTTIRKEKGLTQKQVAEKLGLTVATISKLESGGTQVTFDHLYALAYALEVEPDALFETLEIGIKSFIEGGGVLTNNFYKNENQVTENEDILKSKNLLIASTAVTGTVTAAFLGASAVVNPLLGGALLMGALGATFSKHLSKVINESDKK